MMHRMKQFATVFAVIAVAFVTMTRSGGADIITAKIAANTFAREIKSTYDDSGENAASWECGNFANNRLIGLYSTCKIESRFVAPGGHISGSQLYVTVQVFKRGITGVDPIAYKSIKLASTVRDKTPAP